MDPTTALIAGGIIGYMLKPDGTIEPIDYSKLAAMLDGSDKAFIKKVSIDTSEARDKEKYNIAGMQIFVKNPSTPSGSVYIRFNRPDGEEFDLTEYRRMRGPFGSFYITNEAGAGTLELIVTKGFQFELTEAVGTMSATIDHGTCTGLTDDDHTQYLKEKASGGVASEVATHTHQVAGQCGQLDHGAALSGLSDDDHTQYYNSTRHTKAVHDALGLDHGSLSGLTDDDHTQYLLADGSRDLSGNLTVNPGVLIDGINISVHAANASAHHAKTTSSEIDHGSVLGLTDDDHAQYVLHTDVDDTPVNGVTDDPISSNWAYDHKAILTTQGDIIKRGASDWERLAKGTEGQILAMGASEPAWADPTSYFEQTIPIKMNCTQTISTSNGDKDFIAANATGASGLISTDDTKVQKVFLLIIGRAVNTYAGTNALDCTTATWNQWQIDLDNGGFGDLTNEEADGQMLDNDWRCTVEGAIHPFTLMFDVDTEITNIDGKIGVRLAGAQSEQDSLIVTIDIYLKVLWKL